MDNTKNKSTDDIEAEIREMLIRYKRNREMLEKAKAKAEDFKKFELTSRSKLYLQRSKLLKLRHLISGALPLKGQFNKKPDLAALPKIDNMPKGKIDVAKMRELSQKLSKM